VVKAAGLPLDAGEFSGFIFDVFFMYFCHFLTGYAHSSCFWLVFHFIFHSFFTCFYCELLFSGSKNEAKTDSKTSQKRLKNATVSTPNKYK
jgi:hypothetical protein